MDYLFFDIECCNGHDICEFGYIVTDENFEIKERACILVNPERRFDLANRKKDKDISLHFSEEEYSQAHPFPYHYERIRSVIQRPDVTIWGHAINNDANFLNIACLRYGLDPIDFEFYDTQVLYAKMNGDENGTALDTICALFGIEADMHESDIDAEATMKVVVELCRKEKTSVRGLIEKYPSCYGSNKAFLIATNEQIERFKSKLKLIFDQTDDEMSQKALKYFSSFCDSVSQTENLFETPYTNQTLNISKKYVMSHRREAFLLVQLMKNHGIDYEVSSEKCDFFVQWSENGENYVPHKVRAAQRAGRRIKVITFDRFLKALHLSEAQICALPQPPIESFIKKYRSPATKRKTSNSLIEQPNAYSIGEMIGKNDD